MRLPSEHPLRVALNNEVHARPPEPLKAPVRMSYLALLSDGSLSAAHWKAVSALCSHFAVSPPAADVSHFRADLGPMRLVFERHTEFVRYTFIVEGLDDDPFTNPALARVPDSWIKDLPGEAVVAAHVALVPAAKMTMDPDEMSNRYFSGNTVIGSSVSGALATALTDVRIQPDGFGRHLILDRGLAPRQAGRVVQRLLEIDTYRMLALLALPVARELGPQLAADEDELGQITREMAAAGIADEPKLLDRLTGLQADIESQNARTHYRFSAASAYYDLVQSRIEDLRESRIEGMQTFAEFTGRRLAPAMNTCAAAGRRLRSLSERVARTTQLLSTRVDITREKQNQGLLESMNRRVKLQLRLQQTVEGLSIAAITYYIVGIIGYFAKGLKAGGMRIDADIVTAVAIPIVLIMVGVGLKQMRNVLKIGKGDR
jgi:uncharacterized membrane-anchored protein